MSVAMRPLLSPLPFLLAAGIAQAEPRHMEATGSRLAIDGTCAKAVTIEPDASLSGRVVVDAVADHPEETAQLALESGGGAKLNVASDQCWHMGQGWEPTMTIAVRVPSGFYVSIEEGGGVEYHLGAIGGKLDLDLSGGVRLHAAKATDVNLDLSGGGVASIAAVNGAMKADISGGGTVTVLQGKLQTLELEISGGGGFELGGGSVGKLSADLSGGGEARLGGVVGDAALEVSGGGSVEIAKATGAVTKDLSGAGSVNIGGQVSRDDGDE